MLLIALVLVSSLFALVRLPNAGAPTFHRSPLDHNRALGKLFPGLIFLWGGHVFRKSSFK